MYMDVQAWVSLYIHTLPMDKVKYSCNIEERKKKKNSWSAARGGRKGPGRVINDADWLAK